MHRLVISKEDVERAAWDVERKPESMSADDSAVGMYEMHNGAVIRYIRYMI